MNAGPTQAEANHAREELELLRMRVKRGDNYVKIKKEAAPHMEVLNAYLKKRAKDFGVSFKPASFEGMMR